MRMVVTWMRASLSSETMAEKVGAAAEVPPTPPGSGVPPCARKKKQKKTEEKRGKQTDEKTWNKKVKKG